MDEPEESKELYLQDVLSFAEAKKYSDICIDCIHLLNKKWPDLFEEETTTESINKDRLGKSDEQNWEARSSHVSTDFKMGEDTAAKRAACKAVKITIKACIQMIAATIRGITV